MYNTPIFIFYFQRKFIVKIKIQVHLLHVKSYTLFLKCGSFITNKFNVCFNFKLHYSFVC